MSSKKCRIPNIDPFNENVKPFFKPLPYVPCSKVPLLTYTSVSNNIATLHLDQKSKALYAQNGDITCCYSAVSRGTSKTDPDDVVE